MMDYDWYDSNQRSLECENDHMLYYDKVDEGNWIGWLNQKKKLNSLTWIANKYSVTGKKKKYIEDSNRFTSGCRCRNSSKANFKTLQSHAIRYRKVL